jgi:mono/diheme cytochrome c family protein
MRRPISILTSCSPRLSALALSLALCACSANGYIENGKQPSPPDQMMPVIPIPTAGVGGEPVGGAGGAPAMVTGGSGGDVGTGGMPAMVMPPVMNMPPPDPLPPARVSDDGIPVEIFNILQARCASCHTYGQGDLAGWGSALDLSRMIDAEIVVPGDINASRMIDRIQVRGDMPPRGERVPGAEVDKLRAWIMGLNRPVAESPRSDLDILDAIAADVNKQRSFSSDFRYFSLAHFTDLGRPDKETTVGKNVLAFIVNSLSRRGNLVPMVPIDPQGSIYRIRLSDLGWDNALWDQLTSFYPYCLASDVAGHQSLYNQLKTEAPFVRADWLLDTATRAPLYDQLVDLPRTLDELAGRLGINIADDINHPGLAEPEDLVRFAVRRSGVSSHNRMAERHLGAAGQYLWVSYDFKSDSGAQDVFANPLGPKAVDQQRFAHTFQHDAGEVIFSLPNGMQGYMLVNAAGQRLALADTAIVRDIRRPNAVVENGLSCFGCHAPGGMIRPRQTNEMNKYLNSHVADFQRNEFNEISILYPAVFSPDFFTLDSNRYRATVDSIDGGPIRGAFEYTEFVALVGQYESNLGFHGAAAEFNEDPTEFRNRVLSNDFQNRAFPRAPSDPLISRTDLVCAWRELAPKIRPQRFCAKTFNAAAVAGLCR